MRRMRRMRDVSVQDAEATDVDRNTPESSLSRDSRDGQPIALAAKEDQDFPSFLAPLPYM